MNKYRAVASLAFMDRIAWRADSFMGVLAGGARILMAWIMWKSVFGARPEVAGFSLGAMTTYYLIGAFIGQIDQSAAYVWEFSGEIRGGMFAKYLVRPIKPLFSFLALCAGRSGFRACVSLAAVLLWAIPFSGVLVAPDPVGVLESIPLFAMGLCCLALVNFMVSMLAFVVQDILPIHLIKNILIDLLSGTLIPLAVLPGWARSAVGLTPFPSLVSTPAMLWLGRGSEGLASAYLVTFAWMAVLFLSASALCERTLARHGEVGV
jgi:ABC-2 type transport system permease protein